MFKNKKFEVKVVDDKPNQQVQSETKPRFSSEEISLLKQTAKIIGIVWIGACVIDAVARVAVANQENQNSE